MIRFACPRCGMQLSAPKECAGRSSKCRQCGRPVAVPAPATLPRWAVPAACAVALLTLAACAVGWSLTRTADTSQPVAPAALAGGAPGGTPAPDTVPAGSSAKAAVAEEAPAAGMKWLALTEDERSRWKRMRNKVQQQFEAAVKRVGDPTDILMADGVIVPGTEEEMRKQQQESEKKIAELQRKRLEEARGRRFQYLVYSSKAKSWAAASITTTFTNAGTQERPAFGTGLPQDRDSRFGTDMVFTTYLMDDEEAAQRRTAALAAVPDVRCVAVVDLYSADDPSLVWWVHDDGGGARRDKEPPFPELLDGLRQFVHSLQTTAE